MISRAATVALVLVAAVTGGSDLRAQPAAADAAGLRERVERRFEILPLREGLALRPRDTDTGVRSIEIAGGTIAIDGAPATGAELRQKLGTDADLVLQISYLGDTQRAELLGSAPASAVVPPPPAPDSPPAPAPPAPAAAPAITAPESPAPPSAPERRRRSRGNGGDDRVRFGGSIRVAADEIVDGDVVAIGGHVTVDGEVRGDVVAVGGGMTLGPRASVSNNIVVVGGSLRRDPGARVGGDVQEVGIGTVDFSDWNWTANPMSVWGASMVGSAFALLGTLARVAILCLLAALVILLGREYVERAGARAAVEPLKAAAIGVLAQLLFLPILVITIVVLVITIVGIPLVLLIPFLLLGLALVGLVGFTAVANRIGLEVTKRLGWSRDNPYLVTVIGIGTLLLPAVLARVVGLVGFPVFPITGVLIVIGLMFEYLAWTIGFGSMALLRFARPRVQVNEVVIPTPS